MGETVSVNCPRCGKTSFVTIGGKRFCSACGAKADGSAQGASASQSPAAGSAAPATMADIKLHGKTLDLRATGAAKKPTASAVDAKPAGLLHGRQVSGAMLDLRPKAIAAAPSKPADTPAEPAKVEPTVSAASSDTNKSATSKAADANDLKAAIDRGVAAAVAATATEPTKAEPAKEEPKPTPPAATPRLALTNKPLTTPLPPAEPAAVPVKAALVPPPPVTIKPVPPTTPKPVPQPELTATPATPKVEPASPILPVSQSPSVKKFTPDPTVTPPAVGLPNVAASQVDAMSTQAATVPPPPTPPQSPALQQALAAAKQSVNTPAVVKIGAAVAAIALMASVVWIQNSPKLAFHSAASKAGIDATLPTYMPSSYHQAGPVSVSPGQLTIAFASPSASNQLKITQQESSWDANSLRDNYITHQTANYLTVQGQGLTIYLFGNQANWINHGVWYQLTGIASLSRNQVLKVAYGL